jgi:hypothetical protein
VCRGCAGSLAVPSASAPSHGVHSVVIILLLSRAAGLGCAEAMQRCGHLVLLVVAGLLVVGTVAKGSQVSPREDAPEALTGKGAGPIHAAPCSIAVAPVSPCRGAIAGGAGVAGRVPGRHGTRPSYPWCAMDRGASAAPPLPAGALARAPCACMQYSTAQFHAHVACEGVWAGWGGRDAQRRHGSPQASHGCCTRVLFCVLLRPCHPPPPHTRPRTQPVSCWMVPAETAARTAERLMWTVAASTGARQWPAPPAPVLARGVWWARTARQRSDPCPVRLPPPRLLHVFPHGLL